MQLISVPKRDTSNITQGYIPFDDDEPELSDLEKTDVSQEYKNVGKYYLPSTSQMRVSLPTTSMVSDRYGLPDRATAAVTSAVLQDVGLISNDDIASVIDRSKIRRERSKMRKELQKNIVYTNRTTTGIGIYFDGRKDKTLSQVKEGGKFYKKEDKEEHISLIIEPGGKYFGHVTPSSGSSRCISEEIIGSVKKSELKEEDIKAVGCDGTVVNTGHKGGVIRHLELKLQKSVQWFICLLHFIELPFRHLYERLDGTTSGPRSFSGSIGKSLQNCELLPIQKFRKVDCELPYLTPETVKDLSTDQKYLSEVSQAVQSGFCSPDLSRRDPGPLSHSRWLTAANRILRLYMGTEEPSDQLNILVKYILKVYCNGWFSIKMKPSCTEGPNHLLQTIINSRYLPDDLKKIIDPVIARNSYFAHPENLLLAMLADQRQHIRDLAVHRIERIRSLSRMSTDDRVPRHFVVPKINFEATDYINLIDWFDCELETTEPPVIASLTSQELQDIVTKNSLPNFDIMNLPCHTQAVERCVKLVTESASKVCGQERRDGFIRATLASRSTMPSFNTKSEYKF